MTKKEKIKTKLKDKLRRSKKKDIKKVRPKYDDEERGGRETRRKGDKERCKRLLDETTLYDGDVDTEDAYKTIMSIIGR